MVAAFVRQSQRLRGQRLRGRANTCEACSIHKKLLTIFVHWSSTAEYNQRECPTRLFSIMRRSVTTAPVVATFVGEATVLPLLAAPVLCWRIPRAHSSGDGGAWGSSMRSWQTCCKTPHCWQTCPPIHRPLQA